MAIWLREGAAVERKFAEWSAHGVIGKAREAACRERFGFSLRNAQYRLCVRDIVQRYKFTEAELSGVDPSKLRRLATKPLPSSRRDALVKVRAFGATRGAALDDLVRVGESPQLRKALGAVIARDEHRYLVSLAVERSKGQLVTFKDLPFDGPGEATSFVRGASWPVGTVYLQARFIEADAIAKLRDDLMQVGRRVVLVTDPLALIRLGPRRKRKKHDAAQTHPEDRAGALDAAAYSCCLERRWRRPPHDEWGPGLCAAILLLAAGPLGDEE